MYKNRFFFSQNLLQKLLLLSVFLAWNTAWSMRKAKKPLTLEIVYFYDKHVYRRIFKYLPSSDIISFRLTAKASPDVSEAADFVCSNRPLSLNQRYISDEIYSSIKKGHCRKIAVLTVSNFSNAMLNPRILEELPDTLVALSIDRMYDENHYFDEEFFKTKAVVYLG